MFEEQMEEKILSFIRKEGYAAYPQIPMFLGKIDFVGVNENSECLVIESKVKNWKKALKQALRYGYGAEKVYVALPTPTARNIEKKYREIFENYKIGLIEISKEVDVLISCKAKAPSVIFKQVILNKVEKRKVMSHQRIMKFKERFKNDWTLVSV